jgi:hypothetical protein
MSNRGKWQIDPATGKLVDYVEKPRPLTTMIITDEQEPLMSHADGKIYTSKSRMRGSYRDLGFVELGNDEPSNEPWVEPNRRKNIEETIEKTINQLRWDEIEFTEKEKAYHKEMNERLQKND